MDELLVGFQSADGVELLLYEVFHGLDVVVGDALYVLYALCVGHTELLVDLAQAAEQLGGELRQLGYARNIDSCNCHCICHCI